MNGAYTLGGAYTYVGRCMLDMNFGAGEVQPIATYIEDISSFQFCKSSLHSLIIYKGDTTNKRFLFHVAFLTHFFFNFKFFLSVISICLGSGTNL